MRVQPLPADQWDEAAEQSLSGMLPPERRNPKGAGNLMSTLARHPKLAHAYPAVRCVPTVRLDAARAGP